MHVFHENEQRLSPRQQFQTVQQRIQCSFAQYLGVEIHYGVPALGRYGQQCSEYRHGL